MLKNGGLEPFRPSASPRAEKNLGCHLPAFDPHFPTWKYKITAHFVFPTVFPNCYWKKVKQNTNITAISCTRKPRNKALWLAHLIALETKWQINECPRPELQAKIISTNGLFFLKYWPSMAVLLSRIMQMPKPAKKEENVNWVDLDIDTASL